MSDPRRAWRLLVDGRAEGAWNMAVDEALLDSVLAGGPPTVRLYGFDPAALSIGRHQNAAGAHDPGYLQRHGIELIRRPTGGLAVLHEHERTYSVVGRLDQPPFDCGVLATYRAIAGALAGALGALGVAARTSAVVPARATAGASASPACFASPTTHEIVVGGRKIVGSAQLRRRNAFLQHGSILLRGDAERLERALGGPVPRAFTDLERELGRPVHEAALDAVLIEHLALVVGTSLSSGSLDGPERLRADRLSVHKYGETAWTLDGRPSL